MTFSLDQISFANLNTPGFDAVWFSFFGMAVVFGGLVFISLYITLLPRLLALPAKFKKKKTVETDESAVLAESEQDILTVIATAYHHSQNFPEENEKITWKSHGDMESPWKITGRVHGLSVRNHVGVNNQRQR
jgi:Na+-transporting methylmalonyl-CoA/oxaloacetate decarboxylase gamma subunit